MAPLRSVSALVVLSGGPVFRPLSSWSELLALSKEWIARNGIPSDARRSLQALQVSIWLLGARTLLVAPGNTTRNKKLLVTRALLLGTSRNKKETDRLT